MFLAVWQHHPTVVQAEVVEQGQVQVGVQAGVCPAARIASPGVALKAKEEGKGMGVGKTWEKEEGLGKGDGFKSAAPI